MMIFLVVKLQAGLITFVKVIILAVVYREDVGERLN